MMLGLGGSGWGHHQELKISGGRKAVPTSKLPTPKTLPQAPRKKKTKNLKTRISALAEVDFTHLCKPINVTRE